MYRVIFLQVCNLLASSLPIQLILSKVLQVRLRSLVFVCHTRRSLLSSSLHRSVSTWVWPEAKRRFFAYCFVSNKTQFPHRAYQTMQQSAYYSAIYNLYHHHAFLSPPLGRTVQFPHYQTMTNTFCASHTFTTIPMSHCAPPSVPCHVWCSCPPAGTLLWGAVPGSGQQFMVPVEQTAGERMTDEP